MTRHWTFGQKVGAGFAATVLLTVAIGALAVYALNVVVRSKDDVINVDAALLLNAQRLTVAIEKKGSASRGFFLTGDDQHLENVRQEREAFIAVLSQLRETLR